MSYRNPEIIVDRSAEIFAQGMSNLGQTMVQGVQNIIKQREEQKIAIKKQQDAVNVFTQNLRGDYNKRISSVASGIKDKSFAEQYIAEQTSSYEDLIKDQARLAFNPGSFSKEQIADLNKRVAEVTSRDASAKEFATNVALDLETVQDNGFGEPGSEYVFTGDKKGNGMFKNMIFLYANGNKEIPGIEYEKVYKDKKWKINATINKDNSIVKQLIESGVIDVNDLKDVDGKTVLNFSGDPKDYTSVLMKVDPGVDIQSAMLESGIIGKTGEINGNFFDKEYTSKSSRVPGKDIVTERGVFMEDYVKNNNVFRQNIEKQLLVLNKDNKVQKAWIENRLGEEVPENWDNMTTEQKRAEVTNMLVNDAVEKLKSTLKSGNGESFEEKTTLMDRKDRKDEPLKPDYSDVTSVVESLKSGDYQDVAFPGTVDNIKKSESVAKKGQNIVSAEIEVGTKLFSKEFDLNSKTSLISLAEEIFKGDSKEIRSKRSEFVKQMLSKNNASASDNKEPTGSENDPLIYKPK
jgi:hypothetical protein